MLHNAYSTRLESLKSKKEIARIRACTVTHFSQFSKMTAILKSTKFCIHLLRPQLIFSSIMESRRSICRLQSSHLIKSNLLRKECPIMKFSRISSCTLEEEKLNFQSQEVSTIEMILCLNPIQLTKNISNRDLQPRSPTTVSMSHPMSKRKSI